MKYMWESKLDRGSMTKVLNVADIKHVIRQMHYSNAVHEMVLTSKADYNKLSNWGIAQTAVHWTITSCNKQYISRCGAHGSSRDVTKSRYLGCLKEVTTAEAFAEITSTKWYLLDYRTDQRWIVVNENPNRIIPNWQHQSLKVQERPWPLKSETYDEWKNDIVKEMTTSLERVL